MNCPHCHQPMNDGAPQVTSETVVDIYEFWLARKNGKNPARITERIPIITIQEKGTALKSKPLTESLTEQP